MTYSVRRTNSQTIRVEKNVTLKKKLKVMNPQGLHARPASILVRIANKFESEIKFSKDNETVNGKSIMGIMMLAAEQGSEIEIEVTGDDEVQAMSGLEAFFARTDDLGKTESQG